MTREDKKRTITKGKAAKEKARRIPLGAARRILKDSGSDARVGLKVAKTIRSLSGEVVEKLTLRSNVLNSYRGAQTISPLDLKCACRFVFTPDLARQAIAAADIALAKCN